MVGVAVRALVARRGGVGAGGRLAADERDEPTIHWRLLQHHHTHCPHHKLHQRGKRTRTNERTNREGSNTTTEGTAEIDGDDNNYDDGKNCNDMTTTTIMVIMTTATIMVTMTTATIMVIMTTAKIMVT